MAMHLQGQGYWTAVAVDAVGLGVWWGLALRGAKAAALHGSGAQSMP